MEAKFEDVPGSPRAAARRRCGNERSCQRLDATLQHRRPLGTAYAITPEDGAVCSGECAGHLHVAKEDQLASLAPGVEPCRRYNEKPKYCADLHKVHAGLAVSE